MRYFIRICAVLALTVNFGNTIVSGNARSPVNPQELHEDAAHSATARSATTAGHSGVLVIAELQRRAANLARAATHSTAWIGDRAKVVLNRSWLVENDLEPQIRLVKAVEEKRAAPDSGSLAPLADWVRLAKGTFRPISDAELTAAQADLKARLDRLGWLLSASGADAQAAVGGWKDAIHWNELQAEVGRGKDARPDELRRLTEFVHEAQGSGTLDHSDDPTAQQANLDFRSALQEVRAALHRYRLLLVAAGPNGAANSTSASNRLPNRSAVIRHRGPRPRATISASCSANCSPKGKPPNWSPRSNNGSTIRTCSSAHRRSSSPN